MNCNNHLPFTHSASCSKGNFVFSVDKTILENSFKSERQENISKIILMLESDLESRMIAIELSKTMELDCYDLCQLVKKKYLKIDAHLFIGSLAILEYMINGLSVEQLSNSYSSNVFDVTCITLSHGLYKVNIEHENTATMINKFMAYESIFEKNPYEWLLLNWDN